MDNVKLPLFLKFWTVLVLSICLYTAIETPLVIAFPHALAHWTIYFDLFAAIVFLVDLFFLITPTIQTSKAKIRNIKEANSLLLSTKFLLYVGIIGSIPFDFFVEMLELPPYIELFDLVRVFKLLRAFKIVSLGHIIHARFRYGKLAFIAVWVLLGIHFITCVWIAVNPRPLVLTFQNYVDIYMEGFYWSVATLTTVGYGDIIPVNNAGRIVASCTMLLGVGFFGLIIGYVSQIFIAANKFNKAYKEKIDDLAMFMSYYNIPMPLQDQIFSFYDHYFGKRLSNNDHLLINELPASIQNQLAIFMKMKMMRNIFIFQKLNEECQTAMASKLNQEFFSPGEYIIKIGDIGDKLYLMAHGEAEVIDVHGDIFALLGEGNFFGERALLEDSKRIASVRAKGHCDLYSLKKEDFNQVMKQYPFILNEIIVEINLRSRMSDGK